MLNNRLATLATIEPYIGKYYSNEYVRRKILRQTDAEIIEINEQIEDEIQKGIIPDPSTIDPITGQPLPQPGDMGMEQPQDQMSLGQGMSDQTLNTAAELPNSKDTKKAEI